MAITNAWARQFSSVITSTILYLRWAITDIDLPFHVSAHLPKPVGILTECTWNVRVSRAWYLAFDCVTFSNTLHKTSREIWSLLLKPRRIGLSCWLSALWIDIPTKSPGSRSRNEYSNSSSTLLVKCRAGSRAGGGEVNLSVLFPRRWNPCSGE